MKDVFERDEVRDILRERFYVGPGGPKKAAPKKKKAKRADKPKPDHYEVICISMYKEDLARLDEAVTALKKRGHRKMSRSALIRFALDTMDVGKLPRSY
jgi:hypothetical protein